MSGKIYTQTHIQRWRQEGERKRKMEGEGKANINVCRFLVKGIGEFFVLLPLSVSLKSYQNKKLKEKSLSLLTSLIVPLYRQLIALI